MPEFNKESFERLKTCDIRLVELFTEVVKEFDCIVLEGARDKKTQERYFQEGTSKLSWPDSKHNVEFPDKSLAIDVIPYPINRVFENDLWGHGRDYYTAVPNILRYIVHNIERWFKFGGYVLGVAQQMRIPLTWGGDWDEDNQMSDHRLDDLPHFELNVD
jgi:peptidoglycan L-alanyl-D-glutamate endopeptidase CwlK